MEISSRTLCYTIMTFSVYVTNSLQRWAVYVERYIVTRLRNNCGRVHAKVV